MAADHSISIALEPFPDRVDAEAAWNGRRGGIAGDRFHGHPAFERQYDERPDTNLPMRHRLHVWQPGRWIVTVEAFDDTGMELTDPLAVSDLAFDSGVRTGLWEELPGPRPGAVYLPTASR